MIIVDVALRFIDSMNCYHKLKTHLHHLQVVEGISGLVGDLEPGVELELVEQLREEFALLLLLAVELRQRAADNEFAENREMKRKVVGLNTRTK